MSFQANKQNIISLFGLGVAKKLTVRNPMQCNNNAQKIILLIRKHQYPLLYHNKQQKTFTTTTTNTNTTTNTAFESSSASANSPKITPKPSNNHSESAILDLQSSGDHGVVSPFLASNISRHGPSDGIITLNVGGKEFITLRSTAYSNKVLREHVIRAESNQELIQGKAIFIDRDPTHFGLILQHLRNEVEGLSSRDFFHQQYKTLIQLPKEQSKLRDLFVEARHYQIAELESVLCATNWYAQLATFFGGKNVNPFDLVTQLFLYGRRLAVATGGLSVVMTTISEDFQNLLKDLINSIPGLKLLLQVSMPPNNDNNDNDETKKGNNNDNNETIKGRETQLKELPSEPAHS